MARVARSSSDEFQGSVDRAEGDSDSFCRAVRRHAFGDEHEGVGGGGGLTTAHGELH